MTRPGAVMPQHAGTIVSQERRSPAAAFRRGAPAKPRPAGAPRSPPSKFGPPAHALHLVARQRVIARLLGADMARLVVVQAPAGFGKTTLLHTLHDVLMAQGKAVAWLTLDAGDNDLDRLRHDLARAMEEMCAQMGARPFEPLDQPGAAIIDALVASGQPFVLVLDEFETVHSAAALALIQHSVATLGPGQQIVIGSRDRPLLNLGRLRARQQLLECDAADLRFSLEECTEFLRDKRQLTLTAEQLQKLHQATDGWAAALWLSSLALENHPDPRHFVQTFSGSHDTIASYLAEDVLSRKPSHLQEFILQTSILDQFCVESCNAVTGRSDARQLLDEIERSNMFITALDEQRLWFSYHPLFASFLRDRLEQRYPGLARALHRRAAIWYLEQDRPIRAMDHAVAAGDDGLLLELLQQKAQSLLLQGRMRLLARWFDSVQRPGLLRNPDLAFVYGWVLIHTNRSAEALALLEAIGSSPHAAERVSHAIANAHAGRSKPMSYPASMALRTFSLVMLDRIEETAPIWEGVLLLGNDAYDPFLQTMLMIGCAYYHATFGGYQEARQALDRVACQSSNTSALFGGAVIGHMNSMLDMLQGDFRCAAVRLRLLIGDQSAIGTARYGADCGFSSIYLAEIYYETGNLDEARRLLHMYLPLVKEAGIPDQLISSHVIHARILRADGNLNDALQTLFDMERLGLQRGLPRVVDMARIERARGAILDGDLVAATEMLALVDCKGTRRDVQRITDDIDSPMLARWRLDIHDGRASATLPLLTAHIIDAGGRGRVRQALRAKLLYALALAHAGQRDRARRTVMEALQQAQAQGFIRIFHDEGPQLLELIKQLLEADQLRGAALRAFAEKVIGAAVADGAPDQVSRTRCAGSGEITGRELDVLRLLACGHGNQAIAEKLFVSVTTVRTHLRNINQKFDTHTRTQAIAYARMRGIIG